MRQVQLSEGLHWKNTAVGNNKINTFPIALNPLLLQPLFADVAKLADALDLGSSAARHVGSTPSIRTFFIF